MADKNGEDDSETVTSTERTRASTEGSSDEKAPRRIDWLYRREEGEIGPYTTRRASTISPSGCHVRAIFSCFDVSLALAGGIFRVRSATFSRREIPAKRISR